MLIDVMNDHDLKQLVQFPTRGEKIAGFNSDFSPWSVSGNTFPRQT